MHPARVIAIIALLALPSTARAGGDPWPTMRHDARNTGAAAFPARYRGERPWRVHTGKGIFSTPVVGRDGIVYVGSADRTFLALSPTGRVRWKLAFGGIVDAAAALAGNTVTIGAGDERLYHLRTGALRHGQRRILWTRRPTLPPHGGQTVRWWEGNVAVGPGGDLFAGNTGGAEYRFAARTGRLRWARPAGNSTWTTPAFAPDGTSYWGSLDLRIFALGPGGAPRWSFSTLGFVVSSPALSRDGSTLYAGSFDAGLYALDARTGKERWRFQTRDHIYASPALVEDRAGRTTTIVIASTDGSVYGVDPAGHERWRYDTGDVVRSSPVVGGPAPGTTHPVVYVGAGDGHLYALDAVTGARRWSYDTTPRAVALRDRNDLNGSPALGPRGVYIGGEHGDVTFVPYEYCRHRRDPRCATPPGERLGRNTVRIVPVSAGGALRPGGLGDAVPRTAVLDARLVWRRGGLGVDAALVAPRVTVTPAAPVRTELSGDGRTLVIAPTGMLRPGTRYRVRIRAGYAPTAIDALGKKTPGAPAGRLDRTLSFRTAPARPGHFPRALELRRLAVPQPAFLTSVNQIGFDDYELIAGRLRAAGGRVLLYVVTGRRTADGRLAVDPHGGFDFPIAGRTAAGAFALNRRELTIRYEFGTTPQDVFALRGVLGTGDRVGPGAALYAEANCAGNPTYGSALAAIGLCNANGILPVSGTFLTRAYAGPAIRRPAGVGVTSLRLTRAGLQRAGSLRATFRLAGGARYPVRSHLASLVLTDARSSEPVALDALAGSRMTATARGDLRAVTLRIPPGTALPARMRAYVVTDAFPLYSRALG